MIYVGIDPSLTGTGVALYDDEFTTYAVIEVHSEASKSVWQRAQWIREQVASFLAMSYKNASALRGGVEVPVSQKWAIEAPAYGMGRGNALVAAGALTFALWELARANDAELLEVAPASLRKFLVGKGNAPKTQVPLAVFKRWNVEFERDLGVNKAEAYALARYAEAQASGALEAPMRSTARPDRAPRATAAR